MLLAKVTNKWRNLPKVAPREARKQMVLDLELQATVEPIHPWRALNVERARRLLLEPVIPLWRPDIHLRGEVVQAELNMLNPGNHEARDTNATLSHQLGKQDTTIGYQTQNAATPAISSPLCGTFLLDSKKTAD